MAHHMMSYTRPVTLIADPKVLAIPIRDIQEPMIDVRYKTDIKIGPSPEIDNNTHYTWMRYTVYKKLQEAQTRLPHKIYFCLYEAYRTTELQHQLFTQHLQRTQKNFPDLTQEQCFLEATKLFSPLYNLDGSLNIPPHSTGAAIDVYLVNEQGMALDMGIHPQNWTQDKDASLSASHSEKISPQAQKHRSIMATALHSVGFVNYPTEYWHWSYGDRYWAYVKHHNYAIYGSTNVHNQHTNPQHIVDNDAEY